MAEFNLSASPELLTLADVAHRYRCSPGTVSNRVKSGALPAGAKYGGSRRWQADTLDDWDRKLIETGGQR